MTKYDPKLLIQCCQNPAHTPPSHPVGRRSASPRISKGSDCPLVAAITDDSGSTFDVTWSWEELDGRKMDECSRLSI